MTGVSGLKPSSQWEVYTPTVGGTQHLALIGSEGGHPGEMNPCLSAAQSSGNSNTRLSDTLLWATGKSPAGGDPSSSPKCNLVPQAQLSARGKDWISAVALQCSSLTDCSPGSKALLWHPPLSGYTILSSSQHPSLGHSEPSFARSCLNL